MVVEATLQLSAVVGVPSVTFEAAVAHVPASTLTLTAAGAVMVGSMLSTTVTTCVAVAVLPDPSVTVQVTVVAPNGKLVGALLVVEATLQLSAVVGVPSVTFEAAVANVPASTLTVTAAGAVIVGSMLSKETSTTVLVVVQFVVPSVATTL